jgi:hypothetical protein
MGGNKNFNFFADRFFHKVDKNVFVLFVKWTKTLLSTRGEVHIMKFTKSDIERLEYITESIRIENMDEFEKFLARGFDLDQRWEYFGRPKSITEEQKAEVIRMKAAGQTIAAIAAAVKISGSSVKNIIRAYRDKLPTRA